jgi:hypothetical protein
MLQNGFLLLRVTREAALQGGFSQIRSGGSSITGRAGQPLRSSWFSWCSPFLFGWVVLAAVPLGASSLDYNVAMRCPAFTLVLVFMADSSLEFCCCLRP